MKHLRLIPPPATDPKPSPEPVPALNRPFKGFILPDIPPAEVPGSEVVDHVVDHVVECVVREAVSLGLSLQSAQSYVRSALEAAGMALSPDEVGARVRCHALTYS
jgi:hypothetical protein